MIGGHPRSPLFPYTTLFRSLDRLRWPHPLRLPLFRWRAGRLVPTPMARRRILRQLLCFCRDAKFCRRFGRRRLVHPWNCLANQPLDSADGLAVDWRDDRNCGAASPSPAGAPYAMDVIIGVVWHVKIEDVAHLRDVEAARRNVRGNEQFRFAAAKPVKGGRACG